MALDAAAVHHKARFDADGYCVVKGLFARAEVERLKDEMTALHARGAVPGCFTAVPDGPGVDPLKVYPRLMHPHRVNEDAKAAMLDARVLDILAELLGEEPMAAQSMFYFKPPGARGQALHQDNFYLKAEPGTCVAAWMAVDPADEENGGLFVVPGSQGLEVACPEEADPNVSFSTHEVPIPEGMRQVPVNLAPGDVLFFNGSVIHGSHPNRSKRRFRRSFICHYVGVSCTTIGRHYNPLYLRGGEEIALKENRDGGPCGELFDAPAPH